MSGVWFDPPGHKWTARLVCSWFGHDWKFREHARFRYAFCWRCLKGEGKGERP